jgi:cellulose synthase/poly-beta-1,6-N-acetylglucosamine synthase-like glycosyltransferase
MTVYIVLVLAMGIAYYSLLSHYMTQWNKIESIPDADSLGISVSIIIPFRNEAENLNVLIQSLNTLELGKHTVEVIFVNDHSTDESVSVLEDAKLRLRYRIISSTSEGKKAALKLGWHHASGDVILQTDADCVLPRAWLAAMAMPFFQENIQLVSGPVDFYNSTNFWERMVALDFNALIAIGAAHIAWSKPMICNGANLAYRKSVLQSFDYEENKASGDDVFLLQFVHRTYPEGILFLKNKDAIVVTSGPKSFQEFWNQRIRWASKNGAYDRKENTALLLFIWLYNAVIVGSVISCSGVGVTGAAFLVLFKVLAEEKFYRSFVDFFGCPGWFKTIVLGQPFHILYMSILPPLSQLFKYQWKGRKVR